MAEIEWTEEAKHWLQQIYDYIARDDEEVAWKVILGIYDRVQALRTFPESGHRYEKHPEARPHTVVRSLPNRVPDPRRGHDSHPRRSPRRPIDEHLKRIL